MRDDMGEALRAELRRRLELVRERLAEVAAREPQWRSYYATLEAQLAQLDATVDGVAFPEALCAFLGLIALALGDHQLAGAVVYAQRLDPSLGVDENELN